MTHCPRFDTPAGKAQSLLIQAIYDNSIEGVRFALDHGADLRIPAPMEKRALSFDCGPGPRPTSIFCLALLNNCSFQIIECLLPFADPLVPDVDGTTPLMLAAHHFSPEAVAALLPISDIDAVDKDGCDALMNIFGFFGYKAQDEAAVLECVDLFVKSGASFHRRDSSGRTAFLQSVRRESSAVACRLIPHSDVSLRDNFGANALILALNAGQEQTAIALLGVVDPLARDIDGRDAASLAASRPLGAFLPLLLAECPAALERGPEEPTLLMIAASAQCPTTVEFLIPLCDPKAAGLDGADAFMIAIEQHKVPGSDACALLLLPHADLSLVDALGESALDKARMRGLDDIAEAIEDRIIADAPPVLRTLPARRSF